MPRNRRSPCTAAPPRACALRRAAQCRYFTKHTPRRTHQIHAFARADANITRHLAFRDYLIVHPDVAAKYAALKNRLADACNHNIEIYTDGKDAFIKKHEALALTWQRP